ncbi:MAG: hypothetical protein CO170_03850 [candidate division SR1 bacterium CG_4_9_14_3_um_filter_40_9]|nr:MAG: hypothetical protein CO170_03850 [candidate division SR1 bacterium CG_4_9_14_3_um_filter_40_9]
MEDLQNLGISQFTTMPTSVQEKNVFNEPNNQSGWQVIGRAFLGLAVGGIIAALLFVILTFIGGMFITALGGADATGGLASRPNPLLPLILLFIGFLSTFIGNISVSGLYSLFYGKKYTNATKTFGLLLLTNGILFFILAPIYLVFSKDVQTLFIVLGFHVLFSVFISACQVEFSSNPNYSGSAFMGNIIGFAAALLMYAIIYKSATTGDTQKQTYLLMLLPSILGYTLIPLGAGLREKIYYKFYEMGNNGFFIPSPSDSGQILTGEDKLRNEIEDINIEG